MLSALQTEICEQPRSLRLCLKGRINGRREPGHAAEGFRRTAAGRHVALHTGGVEHGEPLANAGEIPEGEAETFATTSSILFDNVDGELCADFFQNPFGGTITNGVLGASDRGSPDSGPTRGCTAVCRSPS